MLYLYTGTPGSSKTLSAVKFLSVTEQFAGRSVYYYNIKECVLTFKVDGIEEPWRELSESEVNSWYDLPDGCVVFIDECQRIFRPRSRSADIPKKVEELETHRHKGIDIVLCTQNPSLVDGAVLAQVERHTHIERLFQREEANHYVWQKAVKNVDSKAERAKAIRDVVAFDKSYYGKYKSAVFHSPKVSIPLKFILLKWFIYIVPVLFILYFLYMYFSPRFAKDEVSDSGHSSVPVSAVASGRSISRSSDDSEQEFDWYETHTPRVESQPWTAPKYDEVMVAVSAPTPDACMYFEKRDSCTCHTFQATRVHVSRDVCMSIVKGGWFDPRVERVYSDGRVRSVARREPNQRNNTRSRSRSRMISHSPAQDPFPSS